MKYNSAAALMAGLGRPPHGGRGLKWRRSLLRRRRRASAPTRGPWIEMFVSNEKKPTLYVGPHTGAVD